MLKFIAEDEEHKNFENAVSLLKDINDLDKGK